MKFLCFLFFFFFFLFLLFSFFTNGISKHCGMVSSRHVTSYAGKVVVAILVLKCIWAAHWVLFRCTRELYQGFNSYMNRTEITCLKMIKMSSSRHLTWIFTPAKVCVKAKDRFFPANLLNKLHYVTNNWSVGFSWLRRFMLLDWTSIATVDSFHDSQASHYQYYGF